VKISIGKHRSSKKKSTYSERIVFVVGLILMCVILLGPLSRAESGSFEADAVLVMSVAESTREEVMLPQDKTTVAEKKWSFYDYIGELFANMIFGEG